MAESFPARGDIHDGMEPTRSPGSPASDDTAAAATLRAMIDPEEIMHLPLKAADRWHGYKPTYVPSSG